MFCRCLTIDTLTCGILATHAFAIEVEHVEDFFFGSVLIDADIANTCHKGKVDDARLILLVVCHELIKAVVLLAVKGEDSVCFLYELQGLAKLVLGEVKALGA